MPFPDTLSDRHYTAPASADGAAITAVVGAYTNSAWATVLASAPANGLLTGITVRPTIATYYGWSSYVDIDIGVGASPTLIATFKTNFDCRFGGVHGPQGLYLPCPIAIAGITAGQAIKARLRQSFAGDTSTWHVSVTYVRLPLSGTLESTANLQLGFPANGLQQLLLPLTPWQNSSWVTLAASADRVVVGVVAQAGASGQATDIDIGAGTTVRATIPVYDVTTLSGFPEAIPITPIRVNGALSVRARGSVSSGGINVGLITVPYPL